MLCTIYRNDKNINQNIITMRKINLLFIGLAFFTLNNMVNAQWTAVNTGLPSSGTNTNVEYFAVIGSNLFAATEFGVYMTSDSGANWTGVNTGLTNTDIEALAAVGTNLFAGTNGGGIFKSTNNGASWTPMNTGLDTSMGHSVYSFFVSGTNLYAGTEAGVFLSVSPYTSWTSVNTGLPKTDIYAFTQIGSDLFAEVLFNGVYMYNGTSWAAVNTNLPTGFNADFESFAVIGSNLFAGDLGEGVYLSTDNGAMWTAVSTGLTDLNTQALAVYGAHLYAGGLDGGVFLSNNYGTSWTPVNTGLTCLNVQSLNVFGAYLYAGTGNGIFRAALSSIAGINEMQNENIQVNIFPNPCSGTLQITGNEFQKTEMEIYNISGECVLQRELYNGAHEINVTSLSKGIYVIKLTSANQTVQSKLIKE